jgi:methionyl-tRNA formyltransferase
MGALRIVFLGSDAIALPLLASLAENPAVELAGFFTQPDRATGRGQRVQPNAIKEWALARGLPVFQPDKLTEEARRQLADLRPDVALVMAYGHILRDEFIATPRLGTLNFHTSILPKYRGASPIQTAVACGERETGVTLMRIVRRLDAGPIADVEKVAVGPLDTALDVEARLAAACVPLFARVLPALIRGELPVREQDEAAAAYCRKLTKEDGVLDFSAPAEVLAARINGLFPWPCCSVEMVGQPVKVGLADALNDRPKGPLPGTVTGEDADGLLVATGQGTLRLRRLQRPGGRLLSAPEFLRGFPVPAGTLLASRPMPSLPVLR